MYMYVHIYTMHVHTCTCSYASSSRGNNYERVLFAMCRVQTRAQADFGRRKFPAMYKTAISRMRYKKLTPAILHVISHKQ